MKSPPQREQRQVVFLKARLRSGDGWSEATICNASPRGLMVKCGNPPPKGAFVEIRRGSACIVGHVRWSQGGRFGIRTQDRIDVDDLVRDLPRQRNGTERRASRREGARTPPSISIAARAEQSRQFAHYFNWIALAMAGVMAAGFLANAVVSSFSAPMLKIGSSLASQLN